MGMTIARSALNRKVAGLAEVQEAMDRAAFELQVAAEQRLKDHRREGHAHITVEAANVQGYGKIDRIVSMRDRAGTDHAGDAVLSIEFGQAPEIDDEGNLIPGAEGIYVMTGAVARVSNRPLVRRPSISRAPRRRRPRNLRPQTNEGGPL